MYREIRRLLALTCSLLLLWPPLVPAQEGAEPSAEEQAWFAALRDLDWIEGPTTVDVHGVSTLQIPEGYVFLDVAGTDKYLELNENGATGIEVMLAPKSLEWSSYLRFDAEGYVEDDEKIDATALLEALQKGAEADNAERRSRGWSELHVTGWAVPPAYNPATQRLEWATRLRSESGEGVNFSTKILGRRGHATVILVTAPESLKAAEADLNRVLGGYTFKPGQTYAEFVPGDKVAEYGLAALVVGGAAAIAAKKGFWGIVAGFFAAAWKFLIAGAIAVVAGLRRLLGNKSA